MDNSSDALNHKEKIDRIYDFVSGSAGLVLAFQEDHSLKICQKVDGKVIQLNAQSIDEVLLRKDADGQNFLQVNFQCGKKILLTENLVGFKPIRLQGLDMERLPKVVTTPDLLSVVEALEDTLESDSPLPEEIELLKKVFDSVLKGAEAVGFDLAPEKIWLQGLSPDRRSASA